MPKDSLANIIIKIINQDYKKACERCRSLSRKKKEKKWQWDFDWYKNLARDEKQKFVEYRKRCYNIRKKVLWHYIHSENLWFFKKVMMKNRLKLNTKMFLRGNNFLSYKFTSKSWFEWKSGKL